MSKGAPCRAQAARCLAAVVNGASLNQKIPEFEQLVEEKDRALFRQLCYGVLRLQPKLLGQASQLLKKPFKSKDNDLLMLILLGIYQLSETRIPDHAAVSATVGASKNLKKLWAKNLVNGVLRQWQRNQESLEKNLTEAEQQAHPEWLHRVISQAWPEQANAIFNANNQHPPMTLRVNQQLTDRNAYLQALQQADIEAKACKFSPQGIQLKQAVSVNALPMFKQGHVSVQDEAPQLASKLLQLQPQHRVLDTCCAPGGKTCHILETEPQLENVLAIDIDEQRLQRVHDNLDRLQLNADVMCCDALAVDDWWDGKPFDRILLDAPCSATGVIRRNPDIKIHRSEQDIKQLADLQLAFLNALWPTLKPGGFLLYATCSILPRENEQLVAQFCQQQDDVVHIDIDANWGIKRPYGRQLLPQEDGHDGFYYALLQKP
ncbi:MAG: 16S rRNA (cytosine967-C5)-methyltransferase [Pseudohongiellaceae bacterium]|jgi:16S rRNA (cytosine967-C5)-methyltransferase